MQDRVLNTSVNIPYSSNVILLLFITNNQSKYSTKERHQTKYFYYENYFSETDAQIY